MVLPTARGPSSRPPPVPRHPTVPPPPVVLPPPFLLLLVLARPAPGEVPQRRRALPLLRLRGGVRVLVLQPEVIQAVVAVQAAATTLLEEALPGLGGGPGPAVVAVDGGRGAVAGPLAAVAEVVIEVVVGLRLRRGFPLVEIYDRLAFIVVVAAGVDRRGGSE